MTLRVRLDEILPTKEATRSLPRQLDRLDSEVEHLVLTTRNKPRAVLLSVERYEQLLVAAQRYSPKEER
jgi:PHD/YefM family antitoxin component YafN of YafNO toxin-antitoxin module